MKKTIIFSMFIGIILFVGCSINNNNVTQYEIEIINKNDSKNENSNYKFSPSEVIYEKNKEYGKIKSSYCNYNYSHQNKVTIIIKKKGFYDNKYSIEKFNEYFTSVKNNLNINSINVQKFDGKSKNEFDLFIEELVTKKGVSYAIIVGSDLPVVTEVENNKKILSLSSLNNNYSFINRTPSGCKDIALSFIFSPFHFNIEEKNNFIQKTFTNFINYHNNFEETIEKFNDNLLYIGWDNKLEEYGFSENLMESDYRDNVFYNSSIVLNSELNLISNKIKENPFLLIYSVHASEDSLGLGFNQFNDFKISRKSIYTTNKEILDYYNNIKRTPFLFTISDAACKQDLLTNSNNEFCCWPQTWLEIGVWSFMTVRGDEDSNGNTFEKHLYENKIIGKAYLKTFQSQGMIYGDILGVFP